MKPLKDDATKKKIVSLDYAGHSVREIARALCLPRSTVSDFLRKETHKDWWQKNGPAFQEQYDKPSNGPNIYLLDIETSPIEAYVWGLYDQNISHKQIIKDWEILCVCYRKLGETATQKISTAREYVGDNAFLGEGILCYTHQELAMHLREVLDDADIIIAHNAIKFDNRKIRAKLLEHGLNPPSPYKVFDTLKAVKANFGFTSNRKDYLSKKLGGDGKQDTGGMQLWIECLNGDEDAWRKMLSYCGTDLDELERIYLDIRAWDNKHPNVQLFYNDDEERCGTCGSTDLSPVENKIAATATSAYEMVQCNNCGATKRRRQNIRTKEQMKNTLVNVS